MKISVIIPTHNRPQKLQETVAGLRAQNFPPNDYEIVVVDDGSTPPVRLPKEMTVSAPQVSVIRLGGGERSLARNTGAGAAKGEILVFVDDDISVNREFLSAHWSAHQDYANALAVGEIVLPDENQTDPFVRFRQKLERDGVPQKRGLVESKNFCAAANASIDRKTFFELSGFDLAISSSEDQDLALRHTARGGIIVFVPEAVGIHRDNALDIRQYCRRNEWGSCLMKPFYERYQDLPANIERERVNGFVQWRKEPGSQSLRKIVKAVVASPVVIKPLFLTADVLERARPESKLLERVYRLLLGAHIFRGYRSAIREKKTN
jgi:glycosyltransferase involved in cell wall biosynthesis